MFKEFILERRSWIFLFVFLEALMVFISFIDKAISLKPVLYGSFLSSGIFLAFLLFRWQKETRFYKNLADGHPRAETPFEKIVEAEIEAKRSEMKQSASAGTRSVEMEKDELLSWIHEVKTPLTAMQLIMERMEDGPLKADLHFEWLRIHLLLDQQLHQKRIPFMENDLYFEKTDLKVLVFAEIRMLRSWCMQKGIGFETEFNSPEVLTDVKWAGFIIRQVLTNAVKYSGETDIFISSFVKDSHTVLEIKDSGRGIEARDLPRIFDKGFTSTAKHYDNKATGMGLYLAKKAAASLLLDISVRSAPGKGTAVTLTFPKQNAFIDLQGV